MPTMLASIWNYIHPVYASWVIFIVLMILFLRRGWVGPSIVVGGMGIVFIMLFTWHYPEKRRNTDMSSRVVSGMVTLGPRTWVIVDAPASHSPVTVINATSIGPRPYRLMWQQDVNIFGKDADGRYFVEAQ